MTNVPASPVEDVDIVKDIGEVVESNTNGEVLVYATPLDKTS